MSGQGIFDMMDGSPVRPSPRRSPRRSKARVDLHDTNVPATQEYVSSSHTSAPPSYHDKLKEKLKANRGRVERRPIKPQATQATVLDEGGENECGTAKESAQVDLEADADIDMDPNGDDEPVDYGGEKEEEEWRAQFLKQYEEEEAEEEECEKEEEEDVEDAENVASRLAIYKKPSASTDDGFMFL